MCLILLYQIILFLYFEAYSTELDANFANSYQNFPAVQKIMVNLEYLPKNKIIFNT